MAKSVASVQGLIDACEGRSNPADASMVQPNRVAVIGDWFADLTAWQPQPTCPASGRTGLEREARSSDEHPRIPGQGVLAAKAFGGQWVVCRLSGSVDEAVEAAASVAGPLWVVEERRSMPAGAARASSRNCRRCQGRRAARRSRSTKSKRTPRRCSARRWSPCRPARRGKQVNRLYVEDGCDIAKEFYLSHAGRPRDRRASPSSSRPKAAWTSRRWRTTRPRRSSRIAVDPATGLHAASRPARGATR